MTVNYIVKYIHKVDKKHKGYISKILTSSGIGESYTKSKKATDNKYNGEKTLDTYKTEKGNKLALPIYYRNKLYSEEERELLWINKLDSNERWIGGEKVRADDWETIKKLQQHYRKLNKRLGYGDDSLYSLFL